MNYESIKNFSAGLNNKKFWILLYIFFIAVPLGLLHSSASQMLRHNYETKKEQLISYYDRQLRSFGRRSLNDRFFSRMLHQYSRIANTRAQQGHTKGVYEPIQKHFPSETAYISWNNEGRILESINTDIILPDSDETKKFIETLLEYHQESLEPTKSQHDISTALSQKYLLMSRYRSLLGNFFPLSNAVTMPGQLFDSSMGSDKAFFYWNFFNNECNELGGYLFIIPKSFLNPEYGLLRGIESDVYSNPDFANGFYNHVTGEVTSSFDGISQQAEKLINYQRKINKNPIVKGDWGISVHPYGENHLINIFTIFNISNLNRDIKADIRVSAIVFLCIAALMAVFIISFYRHNKAHGISLNKKLTGLSVICMLLPISLLLFVGTNYAISQQSLLQLTARNQLRNLVTRVDQSAKEYYRKINEKLIVFMNNISQVNNENLLEESKSLIDMEFIEGIYIVDSNNKVVFDVEELTNKMFNKGFIFRLANEMLSPETYENNHQSLDESFLVSSSINRISSNPGIMQEMIWTDTKHNVFIFSDIFLTENNEENILIVIIDKNKLDLEYLKRSITHHHRHNYSSQIFAIPADNIGEIIPQVETTFKANIYPLVESALLSNNVETESISDGNGIVMTAILKGSVIDGHIIGAKSSWAKITQSLNRLYLIISLFILLSIIANLLLNKLLTADFMYPVSVINEGAKSIMEGNLDLRLPILALDELGDLSNNFNLMSQKLKNRLAELTLLYKLTRTASASHNPRELFELAANELKMHLNAASSGTVWLTEGDDENAVLVSNHYLENESEAIRKNTVESLKTSQISITFEPDINKVLLIIPLFFEEKKFGTIYLIFSDKHLLEQSDILETQKSFLETLRHHISLIIEKQRLFEQAITDSLTRLYLRRFFLATLEKEISRANRYQIEVGIIMLDIDHFKVFNDQYGHQAGDYLLRETSQRIIESIRTVDTPARYGGEEISIILPQTNIKESFMVAERIRKTIESSEYIYKDNVLKVTVSIGITCLKNRKLTVEEMIEEADKALYIAKNKGRNQVRIAPEAM